MPYKDDELVKQKRASSREAIELAMKGLWQEAIAINKSIIESFPNDVDAFNRLGRAYMETGKYEEAKEAYGKTLQLDPYNMIAEKNLRRLADLKEPPSEHEKTEEQARSAGPRDFIEEVGKAAIIKLEDLAAKEILAKVDAGDELKLRVDAPNLYVENLNGVYLGKLDAPHSRRLVRLIQGGNKYSAAVTSVSGTKLVIIIREVIKHPSQAGIISFPSRGMVSFKPFTDESSGEPERLLKEAVKAKMRYNSEDDDYDADVNSEDYESDDDTSGEDFEE